MAATKTNTNEQDADRPVTREGHPSGRDDTRKGRLTVSGLGEEQACLEAGGWMPCGPQKVLMGPVLFLPVEPAPPVLVFTRTDEILSVNATYELPHCMPQPDLNYEVAFWKEGARNKVRNPFHAPRLGPLPHSPTKPQCSSPSKP